MADELEVAKTPLIRRHPRTSTAEESDSRQGKDGQALRKPERGVMSMWGGGFGAGLVVAAVAAGSGSGWVIALAAVLAVLAGILCRGLCGSRDGSTERLEEGGEAAGRIGELYEISPESGAEIAASSTVRPTPSDIRYVLTTKRRRGGFLKSIAVIESADDGPVVMEMSIPADTVAALRRVADKPERGRILTRFLDSPVHVADRTHRDPGRGGQKRG
ncbi:hypothetical protein [Streptomyces sp. NPDC058092]|uniref:hypothetical protein n=1 Tax=Streptomyces sp. NPDC058092 TaxID=3346336 RepID=UPI0036E8AAB2